MLTILIYTGSKLCCQRFELRRVHLLWVHSRTSMEIGKKKSFYEFDTRISINNMLWGQMYMSVGT